MNNSCEVLMCILLTHLNVWLQDKTFGLKNKKGAKQQKFIQQVEKQVKNAGIPARKLDDKTKDPKKKDDDEIKMLFRPVATQKIEKGW